MTPKFVAVPEGKIIKASSGNYTFVGPCFLSLADKFSLPATYTDGTLLVYTAEKVMPDEPESNHEIQNTSPGVDSEKRGSKRKDAGTNSSDVHPSNPLRKRTSKDNSSEGVHGKCSDAVEHGIGCGAHTQSDADSDETSGHAPEGGLDSDSLGNKAKPVRKPKSDSGSTIVDNDSGG